MHARTSATVTPEIHPAGINTALAGFRDEASVDDTSLGMELLELYVAGLSNFIGKLGDAWNPNIFRDASRGAFEPRRAANALVELLASASRCFLEGEYYSSSFHRAYGRAGNVQLWFTLILVQVNPFVEIVGHCGGFPLSNCLVEMLL